MSKNKNLVKHSGIIQKVEGDSVFVRIIVKSACADCHIKSACNLSDVQEKIIEVRKTTTDYEKGQTVTIAMESSQGFKALFLGYLLPFFTILIGLIIGLYIWDNEGFAALFALALTAGYYLGLYFFKDRMKRIFKYYIET